MSMSIANGHLRIIHMRGMKYETIHLSCVIINESNAGFNDLDRDCKKLLREKSRDVI